VFFVFFVELEHNTYAITIWA
jgi:hypothetical protein